MLYTIAKEKFPRKPKDGYVLEACRKDFSNFKKDNGNRAIEHFEAQIKKSAQFETPNKLLINQHENLENIRNLLLEGKEDVAFSIFFRTFPSCLPHRVRNL
jgi:hypothetical protein